MELLRPGNRLHRLFLRWNSVGLEVTYFHWDDEGQKTVFDISLPDWPWKLLCLFDGHKDDSYGDCVICRKPLRRPR